MHNHEAPEDFRIAMSRFRWRTIVYSVTIMNRNAMLKASLVEQPIFWTEPGLSLFTEGGSKARGKAGGKEMREAMADQMVLRTHRTLQQSSMSLFLGLCQKWADADSDGIYDLRNEATVKLATAIMKMNEGPRASNLPFI